MPAPKGHKRYGGRTAGIPNKSTRTLMEKCEAHGLDVFEALIELAATEMNPDKRFDKLLKLAPYLYAQRKAVEVSSEIDVRLMERAKEISAMPPEEKTKLAKAIVGNKK